MQQQAVRLAGKKGALLPCQFPWRLTFKANGALVPYPARCGWCWACSQTKANDLIGRAGAEALVCSHVDFVTLTYDQRSGAEQYCSARIRNVKHVQDMQKRLRQREHRALKAYNRNEEQAAASEGRKPETVDASRSYIKFLVVHEGADETRKHSHWHILIFYQSHFEVPQDVLASGDMRQTHEFVRRVWSPPAIFGPVTDRLPPDANNPEVIDFRVASKIMRDGRKAGGNQLWNIWPHGFVNVQRVTHDVNRPEGKPVLKLGEELAQSVRYLNKYLRKAVKVPKGKDPKRMSSWTQQEREAFADAVKTNVTRTSSRGLGHDFARADAERWAKTGVPVKDMFYRLEGFEMKRKPESVYKFQQRLMSAGVSLSSAMVVTDSRILFAYQGAMREAFFNAWFDARTRIRGRRPRENEMGEAFIKAFMKRESDEMSEFLRSKKAVMCRLLQGRVSEGLDLLPDQLTPVHVYETEGGVLLDGSVMNGVKLPVKFRKPKERLQERRREIERLKLVYAKAWAEPGKLARLKRQVSGLSLEQLETETLYSERPWHVRQRFKRLNDVDRLDKLAEKLADDLERAKAEGREGELQRLQECSDWLLKFGMVTERDAFGLPRWSLHHGVVSEDVLWRWVNGSDDFGFGDLREKLVAKHFDVVEICEGGRVLTSRTGVLRWYLQRQVFSDSKAVFDLQNLSGERCPAFKAYSGFQRWATRELSGSEVEVALRNEVSLRRSSDRDPLFYGPEPLRPRSVAPTISPGQRAAKRALS